MNLPPAFTLHMLGAIPHIHPAAAEGLFLPHMLWSRRQDTKSIGEVGTAPTPNRSKFTIIPWPGFPSLLVLPPSSQSFLAFPCTNLHFSSQLHSSKLQLEDKGFFPLPPQFLTLLCTTNQRSVTPGYSNPLTSWGITTSSSKPQRNWRERQIVLLQYFLEKLK